VCIIQCNPRSTSRRTPLRYTRLTATSRPAGSAALATPWTFALAVCFKSGWATICLNRCWSWRRRPPAPAIWAPTATTRPAPTAPSLLISFAGGFRLVLEHLDERTCSIHKFIMHLLLDFLIICTNVSTEFRSILFLLTHKRPTP